MTNSFSLSPHGKTNFYDFTVYFLKIRIALQVAIKAINKHTAALGSGASEPSHNIAIQREIAISKRLIHPNICRLFDVVETQNRIYLVMELVEGGYTLRDLIEDEYGGKGMDELTACKLFRQVLKKKVVRVYSMYICICMRVCVCACVYMVLSRYMYLPTQVRVYTQRHY